MNSKKLYLSIFISSLFILTAILFRSSNANAITHPITTIPIPPSEGLTPTPTPSGQLINVDLRMPGIGSAGGNMEPLHPERELSIYLFNSQINTEDKSARPIAVHKAPVRYDSDPSSSTYGSFINNSIYLDENTKEGKYQIVIKLDQALSKLIKVNSSDVGGQLFELRNSYNPPIKINNQEMITGDIYPLPKGDNIMDIHDYNALVSCFGSKADTELCADKKMADLDDNGSIDGVDYNLMFGSFKKLLEAGYPVPDFLNPSRTPKPDVKPTKRISPKPAIVENLEDTKQKGASNSGAIIITTILLIIILIVFIVMRKKIIKFIRKILHKDQGENSGNASEQGGSMGNGEEAVDKDYYIKQQGIDEVNKTIMLTLTDDSGPILGYYKGEEIKEGFAHVKGVMRKDESKVYIEVYEIVPAE
jgi:hypothetical protein